MLRVAFALMNERDPDRQLAGRAIRAALERRRPISFLHALGMPDDWSDRLDLEDRVTAIAALRRMLPEKCATQFSKEVSGRASRYRAKFGPLGIPERPPEESHEQKLRALVHDYVAAGGAVGWQSILALLRETDSAPRD